MSNSNPYGLGLVPNADIIYSFYDLVDEIANKFNLSFSCSKGISIPHLTIFQGKFDNKDILISKIKDLDLNNLNRTQIISGISIWATKIMFLDFELTSSLQSFHTEVFKNIFPLSAKKSADPQQFKDISKLEQQMLDETGYPFSLNAYKPHITMAHFNDPIDKLKKEKISQELNMFLNKSNLEKNILFEKFVIYKVGELGRCLSDFEYEIKI